eukprot:1320839-Amphidinium_carterae.1
MEGARIVNRCNRRVAGTCNCCCSISWARSEPPHVSQEVRTSTAVWADQVVYGNWKFAAEPIVIQVHLS